MSRYICGCGQADCEHVVASREAVTAVGRQFAWLESSMQVEQDENGDGGVSFSIPFTSNVSVAVADVVVSGTNPAGLTVNTVGVDTYGKKVVNCSTPEGTVFAPGTYASIFTVFGKPITVTIYGTLQ